MTSDRAMMQGQKKIIRIRGANAATDQIFELDARILGQPIIWNVTRIVADARRGIFGPTHTILMSELPPRAPEDNASIDWHKVNHFATVEAIMKIPAVNVRIGRHRLPIDGNHRLCAREKFGYRTFETWVVPERLEKNYRVTIEEIEDGENTNTG